MRQRLTIYVVLICMGAVGCGSGRLKPQGQLVKKGAPLAVAEGEVVHIAFFPDDEQADHGPYPALFKNEDSSFRVLGADGRGLPPGKYRATVQIMKKRKDTLDGAYDRKRSPFHVDVASSSGQITLDLDTPPEGPKQAPRPESKRRDQQRR